MRSSFDLPDALLQQAKALAKASGGTVREMVIEGLSYAVARRSATASQGYSLPDCSVDGQGLQPGVPDLHWERLRDLVHDEDRPWRAPE